MAGINKNSPGCSCCSPPFAGCTYTWSPTGCASLTLENVAIVVTPPVGGTVGLTNGCSASVSHTFTALGTYTWSATHVRFSDNPTGSFTVANPCTGGTTFAPSFSTVTSLYACTAYCGTPPKKILTGVISFAGTAPMNYNAGSNNWIGSFTATTGTFDGGPTASTAIGGPIPLNAKSCCALAWDYSAPHTGDFQVFE